jgi:hypothetical protein
MIASLVSVLVMLTFAGGVIYAAYAYRRHQQAKMRAIAEAAGLQIDTSTKAPPNLGFDLFDPGKRKKVTAQMWRAGEQDSVFQYRYTVQSGDNSTTYRFTAALVEVPFRAPHLKIGTETWWSKAKRIVGMRDIEVESAAFNDRYHVRCDDERFAIALLDPPMIAWMLSPQSGGGTVTFEFRDRWMLCHCDQLKVTELPGMLAWAQSVRAQLPAVLTEFYGR